MSGKFTLLLTKREAETYRSHGLHKEAMEAYTEMLRANSNLDPDLKILIQKKIHAIEDEMRDFSAQREGSFTAQDIRQIIEGWGDCCGDTELLVCIHALRSVKAYADAWEELKKLLIKNGLKEIYLKLVVDCLVNLFTPEQLPDVVDNLVIEGLPQKNDPLTFHLTLAEHLIQNSHNNWAIMLYRHLHGMGDLSEEVASHVTAALQQLEKTTDEPAPVCQPTLDGDAAGKVDNSGVTDFLDCCKTSIQARFNAFKKWCGF